MLPVVRAGEAQAAPPAVSSQPEAKAWRSSAVRFRRSMRCPEPTSKAVADPSSIAVFEPRLLRIVVVGVVEAQVEAECRGVAQREVVQRPVARFLRERADVASRRTGESIGVRRERGGVGGAHPAPLFRSILGSGAELVAPPLGGHPFILPDVVLPSLEGVQRAQVVNSSAPCSGRPNR